MRVRHARECAVPSGRASVDSEIAVVLAGRISLSRPCLAVTVVLGALVLPGIARAQLSEEFDKESARCISLSDEAEKADCIRRLTTERWDVAVRVDKLDGSKSVFVGIMSGDTLDGPAGSTRPFLAIRCLRNRTDVTISNWGRYLGRGGIPARWRVDNEPIVSERWESSQDGWIAFASNPISLLKRTYDRKELVVSVQPRGAQPRSVGFHLPGLNVAIRPIREVCQW